MYLTLQEVGQRRYDNEEEHEMNKEKGEITNVKLTRKKPVILLMMMTLLLIIVSGCGNKPANGNEAVNSGNNKTSGNTANSEASPAPQKKTLLRLPKASLLQQPATRS